MKLPFGIFLSATIAVGGFTPDVSHAYPTFIGYGYTSCQVCHFNSFGNGPLTDYGRALGASTIAARGPFAGKKTDEDLAINSSFLGMKRLPNWVRPAADFRGLAFFDELQSTNSRKIFIPMQADVAVTLQSPNLKHWATMSVGYMPDRRNLTDATSDRLPLISREHYLSTQLGENTRVMAGMMDIPFGIRIPDHTAFSRALTQLRQNDQAHMVVLHQFSDSYELGVSAIAGNLFQDSDLRHMGGSIFAEYDVFDKVRVGHSNLYTTNDYRSRLVNALHARIGAGEGSSVLIEVGMDYEKTKVPTSSLKSYFLFENMIRFSRGLHVMVLGEYKTLDTFKSAPRTLRVGPAIQYFPMNGIEIRADVQITRELNSRTVEKDSMDLLMQTHLWF